MLERPNHTISRRLTWMNMLVSGTALLLACTAFIAYDMVTFQANMFRNLSTQAQIIGSNTASALLFNDQQSAENTLSALRASPEILSACIYTPDGRPFATYSRDQAGQVQALPTIPPGQAEIHRLRNREIVLVRSIVFQGKPTAIVYIRSGVEELNRRLERYAGIAAIVLLASMLAALLVSSIFRRAVAEPIVRLAEIAKTVCRDRNYSLRATPTRGGSGELAILIDAFNKMLAQTQQSEGALRQSRDQLEQRVKERTAELETAKKEVEEFSHSVVRAKEEVERASKFKDQFLSTMSHELRTPLNAVLGFSDLLADERYGSLNDRQRRYVSNIHSGGQHLLKLISDILDLSKIEAGRMDLAIQDVPIEAVFDEVANILRPLAEKKSQTLSQNAEAGTAVRADATRLKQMLMNLAGNAIKFTPEGGRIELVARQVESQVRVEVRDTGLGIPPEEQKRIFEAFYRLRGSGEATEGTGLGLAITQRLAELHGSELKLETEPGRGSCFYFSLPGAELRAPRAGERSVALAATGTQTILVIEDDPVTAHLIRSQLTSSGYEAIVCDQPENAARMATELQPDAITLDLLMKPSNGWEIMLELKRAPATGNIPVIVISIVDQPAVGATLGADEYLVKPVDKEVLLRAVQRCLMTRRGALLQRPILVVEDHTPSREMIAELLTDKGYKVIAVADGAEARARVAEGLPELVILDLLLPKVSGFELLAEWRAKARTADLPVFVLTSKDLNREEEQYLRSHAESLFRKQQPWQNDLIEQLQRVLKSAPAVQS
jgi:signal transduction histidine kinase/CheY-like chemotaxis protein